MKITVIPIQELTSQEISKWSVIQQENPTLSSPYFRPEFALAFSEVRKDGYVGIIEDEQKIIGFFPFCRDKQRIGKPIAEILSDYQGLIVEPGIEWDPKNLVHQCKLDAYKFNHMLATQEPFQKFKKSQAESPIIDLSAGYEAYISEQQASSQWLQQCFRKTRKFIREVGTLRFEAHTSDKSIMKLLMKWKSEQYRKTGHFDRFKVQWICQFIDRIHDLQNSSFAGVLSVLYVADEVAAVHFGMRSQSVWHYWLPIYNHQFSQYSPGLILLLNMIEAAPGMGLSMIDLGKGEEHYKKRLMNGSVWVTEGVVNSPLSLGWVSRRAYFSTRNWMHKTPVLAPVRNVKRRMQAVK